MEGVWNPRIRLVLASKSASRRQLLNSAGATFDVDVADIDERALEIAHVDGGGSVEDVAATLARAKALAVSRRHLDALCLGADQTLTLDGVAFHKPETISAARDQLAALAGRTHILTSAFAIARNGEIVHGDEDRAQMSMRALDGGQIEAYLRATGSLALASVGAYQWEAMGVHLFERVVGDHATILGLPLLKVLRCLRMEGALWL